MESNDNNLGYKPKRGTRFHYQAFRPLALTSNTNFILSSNMWWMIALKSKIASRINLSWLGVILPRLSLRIAARTLSKKEFQVKNLIFTLRLRLNPFRVTSKYVLSQMHTVHSQIIQIQELVFFPWITPLTLNLHINQTFLLCQNRERIQTLEHL